MKLNNVSAGEKLHRLTKELFCWVTQISCNLIFFVVINALLDIFFIHFWWIYNIFQFSRRLISLTCFSLANNHHTLVSQIKKIPDEFLSVRTRESAFTSEHEKYPRRTEKLLEKICNRWKKTFTLQHSISMSLTNSMAYFNKLELRESGEFAYCVGCANKKWNRSTSQSLQKEKKKAHLIHEPRPHILQRTK